MFVDELGIELIHRGSAFKLMFCIKDPWFQRISIYFSWKLTKLEEKLLLEKEQMCTGPWILGHDAGDKKFHHFLIALYPICHPVFLVTVSIYIYILMNSSSLSILVASGIHTGCVVV